MEIQLENIGKRYNNQWIFKNLSHSLDSGEHVVILGNNGSGKSTLLQIIAGRITPSQGDIKWIDKKPLRREKIYQYLSLASPYLQLPEELTLSELVKFHYHMQKPIDDISSGEIVEIAQLQTHLKKPVKHLSSGMQQRLKLTLAFTSAASMILLDEPATNLDKQGIEWYQQMINRYAKDRTFIICSNHYSSEYPTCNHFITIK